MGKISQALETQTQAQTRTATQKQSINTMMNSLLDGEGMRARFNDLLGARTPQFISGIVSLVNSDANMKKAFIDSPMSVVQSALKAATYDLPIDQNLGYAYLVPFNNYNRDTGSKKMECSFILGWKGMHQLAIRTGAYKTINITDIREGELKSYNRMTEDIVVEFVEDEDEREKLPVIGYVGYYRLVNGAEKTIYRSVKQIQAHEKKFRKGSYETKLAREDLDAYCRKTVYRELIGKWGVMSIEYQTTKAGNALAEQMTEENNLTISADEYNDITGEVMAE